MSEDDDAEELAFQEAFLGFRGQEGWAEIDQRHRTVVLAEAGAGKTHEMRARAQHISAQGRAAFFIRIEDIDSAFEEAFEVGSAESFDRWLGSQDEAWFFLDSVDEARLKSPKAFEKALRRFSARIKPAQGRAHVCISSRPYAWRAKSDRNLVKRHLPSERPQEEPSDDEVESTAAASATDDLEVRVLQPLNEDDIRFFASCCSTPNIDGLVEELQRLNLMELASRPFDLEQLLDKWSTDRTLGGRRELIDHSITRRLKDIDPDRRERQPLNAGKAREGARALAAAVVLTGKAGIRVPDSAPEHPGIDAEVVLADWPPTEVRWLLDSAIFDGVTYGGVRFRHRDVREFLAAEWFRELLGRGHSRYAVESLIFREQYGVKFVSPRLRVVLPWLILDDRVIRERALALDPEISVDGGDPAQLPLDVRRGILADVVGRIAQGRGPRTTRDRAAIGRIAQPDLAPDTLALMNRYTGDDEVISYLGTVIWLGGMVDCLARMFEIATDPSRHDWTRVVAVRAVMTCGDGAQRAALWDRLNGEHGLTRRILAEVVRHADPGVVAVRNLLRSIEIVAPHAPASVSGLTDALHGFVERLPMQMDSTQDQPLPMLIAGLDTFLERPPFLPIYRSDVSTNFEWLMVPALHAVERLVERHDKAATEAHALAIMLKGATVRHARDYYHTVRLGALVPRWAELNDALFWKHVRRDRDWMKRRGRTLEVPPFGGGTYWSFGPESFGRVLTWAAVRDIGDRKLAYSLAHQIYQNAERPAEWLERLQAVARDEAELGGWMQKLLDPTPPKELLEMQRRTEEEVREIERERQSQEHARAGWIARMRANPDTVRSPKGLEPGSISWDQQQLLDELLGHDLGANEISSTTWRSLAGKFGQEVATAFRDAATMHWRHYRPGLGSEGADMSSRDFRCLFGLVGLEIEASKRHEFPAHLSEREVCLALEYVTWNWDGFPRWLVSMYSAHPQAVMNAVRTELFWALEHAEPDKPQRHLLNDVAYSVPWLHGGLAESLMAWLRSKDPRDPHALRGCVGILKSGGVSDDALGRLAKAKVMGKGAKDHLPYWYAVWVEAEPYEAVAATAKWLDGLDPQTAGRSAQQFITALLGDDDGSGLGSGLGTLKAPKYLKTLYVLIQKHIRAEDDIRPRAGEDFPFGLRHDAQTARDALFRWLAETPGKQTYVALQELIDLYPTGSHREKVATAVRDRAEADGDIEPWTAKQVADFGRTLTSTSKTQRQLFDLTVARVIDLKNWLETGDDSPYRTWQRVKIETEMRTLVTGWLNSGWSDGVTSAQESELANGQRIDISLQHSGVTFPVPVELKLLRDGGWTGPELCERLQNQLVGDYLREGTERCGLFLLIWTGTNDARKWQIGQQRYGVGDLRDALKDYWEDISSTFPNVAAIEVVVIDLRARERKSRR